jgi:hypothetical protein
LLRLTPAPSERGAPDRRRISYPVEAPRDDDVFVRAAALDAFTCVWRAAGL